MAKEYYFLSDLHLGGDGELEHCDFAEEFVAFLKELAQELKRVCGTGGTPAEDSVELQGDLRDRVRDYLQKKGYAVKG